MGRTGTPYTKSKILNQTNSYQMGDNMNIVISHGMMILSINTNQLSGFENAIKSWQSKQCEQHPGQQ